MRRTDRVIIMWIIFCWLITGLMQPTYAGDDKKGNSALMISQKETLKGKDYAIDKHLKTHRISKSINTKRFLGSQKRKPRKNKKAIDRKDILKAWNCPAYGCLFSDKKRKRK